MTATNEKCTSCGVEITERYRSNTCRRCYKREHERKRRLEKQQDSRSVRQKLGHHDFQEDEEEHGGSDDTKPEGHNEYDSEQHDPEDDEEGGSHSGYHDDKGGDSEQHDPEDDEESGSHSGSHDDKEGDFGHDGKEGGSHSGSHDDKEGDFGHDGKEGGSHSGSHDDKEGDIGHDGKEGGSLAGSHDDKEADIGHIPNHMDIYNAQLQTTCPQVSRPAIVASDIRRDQHAATLAAMGRLSSTPKEQRAGEIIAELGDLSPIGVQLGGHEYNFLATEDVITKVMNDKSSETPAFHYPIPLRPIENTKKARITDVTPYQVAIPSIKRWMNYESYVELDESLATTILNTDWNRRPWLRFVASRMMEGAILLEGGIGVMVLCAEVYGRVPELDAHHERIRHVNARRKDTTTSIPHPYTKYPDVEVKVLEYDQSQKLVIGTKTMNILITSTARLDVKSIAMGPSSTNGLMPSSETSIYITTQFVDWYRSQTFDESYNQLYTYDLLAQLRQVRSRFHAESTYSLCRSSAKPTNNIQCRPATIWTLSDFDANSSPSLASRVSQIFRRAAFEVFLHGSNAKLHKSTVTDICESLRDSKSKRVFADIKQLFSTNDNIPIITNEALNSKLMELADSLSTQIRNTNENLKNHVITTMYAP